MQAHVLFIIALPLFTRYGILNKKHKDMHYEEYTQLCYRKQNTAKADTE